MFAVVAYFKDRSCDLIGFANTEEEVNELIDGYISKHGADYLGSIGTDFRVELAA